MGHFAQYRHRGGGSTGYVQPPPASIAWTPSVSTTHVAVALNGGTPGFPVDGVLVSTYLVATPNVINETFLVPYPGPGTGAFAYSSTNVVGIRAAYAVGSRQVSPWSAEKQLTFP
jgi:hypothetical protein